MDPEELQAKVSDCQSKSDVVAITGKQAVRLISLIGEITVYSGITRDEAQLLIDMQSELKDELKAFIQTFLKRSRLDIVECITLPLNDEFAPLQQLCNVCNLITTKPVRGGEYSDPIRHLPGGNYYLAAFQENISKYLLSRLLDSQGYRPATLRETLLILSRDPSLLDRYPLLLVFGSGSSYRANLIPEIRKGRNAERSLKFRQSILAQHGAYHSILAKG